MNQWNEPVHTAWRLHRSGAIHCPDLPWQIARIAFREQPARNAHLRVYADMLGPDNWQEASWVAGRAARDAGLAYSEESDAPEAHTYAACAYNAAMTAAHMDSAPTRHAYVIAAWAACDDARVRAEIVAMAVEAMAGLEAR